MVVQRAFLSLIITVCVAIVVVVDAFIIMRQEAEQVTNFDECVEASFPVQESYPARCITPDGRTFTQPAPKNRNTIPICVDRCGDGICQEVVCLAAGCPCPETAGSCPQDCSSGLNLSP